VNPARLDTALGREYVATPWVVLPSPDQAMVIGELSRHCGDDWHLSVDPSREALGGPCVHDTAHGDGVVQVNGGFPLCVGCATKLLGYLRLPGEQVEVTVLREDPT
jgi:hypothetical protein